MHIVTSKTLHNRRQFIRRLAAAGGFYTIAGLYSEALAVLAPQMTQGPYYPLADDIPLDKDNDLVQVGDNASPADGQIHYLYGRVLDENGEPVKNALVELWHADVEGEYLYYQGAGRNPACDSNFAGFGQFLTGSNGAFLFRTIKAGLYVGRARHFHISATIPGRTTRFCTQLGWNETAYTQSGSVWSIQNSNDSIFRSLSPEQQNLLMLDYTPVENAVANEVQASFDFQLGFTPVEPDYPASGGFLVKGEAVLGPSVSVDRYKLSFPAYAGYTYEIYRNPDLGTYHWRSIPFSLQQSGVIDRHKHTVNEEGTLDLYVDVQAAREFYKVTYRAPGENTGTP